MFGWYVLACVGCWACRELGPAGWGKWVDCNEFVSEGVELCSSRRCVVSCWSVLVSPFVLVNLGTERRDLGATEESECDSSPGTGGGGEAGMF
jgi:hypothetical protein